MCDNCDYDTDAVQYVDAETRVSNGVGKLTEHFGGPAWVHDVDLFTLDITDSRYCLGSQLFGYYSILQERLDLWGTHVVAHGFDFYGEHLGEEVQEEWVRVITQLRIDHPVE